MSKRESSKRAKIQQKECFFFRFVVIFLFFLSTREKREREDF